MAPLLALALLAAPLSPARFTGFSADSRSFAYAAMSAGAGAPVLRVVRCRTGKIERTFVLAGPAQLAEAERFLRAGGFDSAARPAPPGVDQRFGLSARVEDGRAWITLTRRGGRGARTLWESSRPGVRIGEIGLWGFSPSGRYAAFHARLRGPTEFGGGEEYLVVDVEHAVRQLGEER